MRLQFQKVALALALILAVAAVGLIFRPIVAKSASAASDDIKVKSPPTFVGAGACATCHPAEMKAWTGSHHQLAMLPADEHSVLGDFTGAQVKNGDTVTIFFRLQGKFMVRTDGPDGKLHDYAIKYTFGVSPLQQYLIEMPGGRLQALGIAWDSRPRARGGQKWFALYPERKITSSDPLHWTGIDQNWNYMCADCHSTNLRKNYNDKQHTYATTYSEVDVACEACHGPGSRHVAWAQQKSRDADNRDDGLTINLNEHKTAAWRIDPVTSNGRRANPRTSEYEIQMCARCHSRRSSIHEDYVHGQPVGDDYRVSLLDENLYFPDGQIKGEVYEYGSFIQSRMFHAGVTCSDCHEPHNLKLRAEGNQVCLQCHAAGKYDNPSHHFHKSGSQGALCANCHMPERTYMLIDRRRDHSIRIPRPDLSVSIGVPNACNNCHTGKSAKWAAEQLQKRHSKPGGFQAYGVALHAAELGEPGAVSSLIKLVSDTHNPTIARATAIERLDSGSLPDSFIQQILADPSPLVRRAIARSFANSQTTDAIRVIGPLLSDPVRAVRIETASALAGVPTPESPDLAKALQNATTEYIAAQRLNSDRPEAHLNLATLYLRTKEPNRAVVELQEALGIDPAFAPAAINLADLYRGMNNEIAADQVLREALKHEHEDPALQYALGLSLVRRHQRAEAIAHLAEADRLAPGDSQYGYTYAIALSETGKEVAAIGVLKEVLRKNPYDRQSLELMVSLCQKAQPSGDEAAPYLQRLKEFEQSSHP